MKIVLANDHHGIDLKGRIISYLNSKNIEYINLGFDKKNNVDYVDYAKLLCECIKDGKADYGILICGTGIGMSIALNKMKGIYCAKVSNPSEATLCKAHNNANCIAISEEMSEDILEEVLNNFINTPFSNVNKYVSRNNKIKERENG